MKRNEGAEVKALIWLGVIFGLLYILFFKGR